MPDKQEILNYFDQCAKQALADGDGNSEAMFVGLKADAATVVDSAFILRPAFLDGSEAAERARALMTTEAIEKAAAEKRAADLASTLAPGAGGPATWPIQRAPWSTWLGEFSALNTTPVGVMPEVAYDYYERGMTPVAAWARYESGVPLDMTPQERVWWNDTKDARRVAAMDAAEARVRDAAIGTNMTPDQLNANVVAERETAATNFDAFNTTFEVSPTAQPPQPTPADTLAGQHEPPAIPPSNPNLIPGVDLGPAPGTVLATDVPPEITADVEADLLAKSGGQAVNVDEAGVAVVAHPNDPEPTIPAPTVDVEHETDQSRRIAALEAENKRLRGQS